MAKAAKPKKDVSPLLMNTALYFMHALMVKVFFANLDKKDLATLITVSHTISEVFSEAQAKADAAIADTAVQFLHGILQKENFEQLTAKRINDLVDQAIDLATQFNQHT